MIEKRITSTFTPQQVRIFEGMWFDSIFLTLALQEKVRKKYFDEKYFVTTLTSNPKNYSVLISFAVN